MANRSAIYFIYYQENSHVIAPLSFFRLKLWMKQFYL